MALYNRTHTLLQIGTATDTDQTSHIFAIVPQNAGEYSFRVFVDLEQSGGEGTPTSEVRVETSHDGNGWIPVITPVSLNEAGEAHEFEKIEALGPLVRARTVLGGTTKPSHTATVKLVANADFAMKVKAMASSSAAGEE